MVSDLGFLWFFVWLHVCVYVSGYVFLMFFLCFLPLFVVFCSGLFVYWPACFLKRERKKAWSWMCGEMERIWKEIREGKP